jgi:ABC-type Fe3+/spermidine/putrescine transport system ATPase subunit
MSDRIAVMNHGRIEQIDPPEFLYERPHTRFVAEFLGVSNVFRVTPLAVTEGLARLRTERGLEFQASADGFRVGAPSWVGLRPERISLVERSGNVFDGVIEDEVFLGDWTDWRVRVGSETISVGEGNVVARGRAKGDAVVLSFPPAAVLRLEDGEAVRP